MTSAEIKARVENAEAYAQIAAEEALELEKWGAITAEIARNPEEAPFKSMLKALNLSGKPAYEKRVLSPDRLINQWITSHTDKGLQDLETFIVGGEKQLSIAEAAPEYFNAFHYQSGDSEIDNMYSQEAWQGVSDTFYKEAAQRRSVLFELQTQLVKLNLTSAEQPPQAQAAEPPPPEAPPAATEAPPTEPPPVAAPLGEPPQPKPPVDKEEYDRLYSKYYPYFLAQGFAEPNAKDMAKKFVDDLMASKRKSAQDPTDFEIIPSRVVDSVVLTRESTPASANGTSAKAQGAGSKELEVFMRRANQRAADYQGSPVKRGIGRLFSDFKNATMSGSPGQADFEVVDSEVVSSQVVSQPSQVSQAAKSAVAVPVAGAGAVAKFGASKILSKAADKLAMLGGPPLIAAKTIFDQVVKFIPKELKEKIKDILSKGTVFFLTYKLATLGGLFGGALGAAYGFSVLGIPGAFIGFVGGFTGGFLGANALLSSLSGLGASLSWQAAAASLSSVPGGLLTFFAGAAAPPILAVGAISFGTLFVVITTAAAFFVPSSESREHAKEAVLTVEKTANPDALPNYDYNSQTPTAITYTVTINAGTNPIEIRSITDKVECQKDDGPCKDAQGNAILPQEITVEKPSGPIEAEGSYTKSYPITIVGIAYKDSLLVNTVTVVAYDPLTQKEETEVASFAIPINNPPAQQPYGFPIAGKINSLDGLFGNPPSKTRRHSSYFRVGLTPARSVIGGIDIGATGEVRSTSGGKVIMAEWFGPGQGCNSTGGTIYVKSGPYIIAYLHLDSSVVSLQGKTVFRGMPLGKVYPGELDPCTSTGPHLHYQVALTSGGNVNFMNPSNAGACIAGKIEPGVPELKPGSQIPPDWVAPACASRNEPVLPKT